MWSYEVFENFQPFSFISILYLMRFPSASEAMLLAPSQCRAARALLDWTQDDLAARAGVGRSTVRGFEGGQHMLQRATAAAIRRALEEAGVIFLCPEPGAGPGVRLSRMPSKEPTA
jgi:DNA-binding XRE family transcriptional regulator